MQIILNQKEIEEAVRQHVLQQISIQEGQDLSIEFEDETGRDLSAVISIVVETIDRPSAPKKSEPAEAPKPRGRPRKTAQEPVQEASDTPWKEEEKDEPEDGTMASATKVETTTAPAVSVAAKIFPEASTSAPPVQAAETPPASGAKSLFANLTKPVHDTPKD